MTWPMAKPLLRRSTVRPLGKELWFDAKLEGLYVKGFNDPEYSDLSWEQAERLAREAFINIQEDGSWKMGRSHACLLGETRAGNTESSLQCQDDKDEEGGELYSLSPWRRVVEGSLLSRRRKSSNDVPSQAPRSSSTASSKRKLNI